MLKLPKVVKVLTARGDELPATTHAKARRLVRDGKAKYVSYSPRVIQLLTGGGEVGKIISKKALILAAVIFTTQFIPAPITGYFIVGTNQVEAMTVYDPTNHKENLATKLNTIEQLQKQAEQIKHEIANLTKLDPMMGNETTAKIRENINQLSDIRKTVSSINSDYQNMMASWDDLYPDYEKWNGVSAEEYAKQVEKVNKAWEAMVKQSMGSGTIANPENQQHTAEQVVSVLDASQNAEGAMGALQAGNQLAAITINELQKTQAIMSDSMKTQSMYYQKQIDAEKAGKKRTEEFYANQEKYKNIQIQDTGAEIGKFKDA